MSELSEALKALEELHVAFEAGKSETHEFYTTDPAASSAREKALAVLNHHRNKPKVEESALDKEYLKNIAKAVQERLPDGYGFILLAAGQGKGGRTNYISNLPRNNAIDLMAETTLKFIDNPENFGKHVT